MNIFADFQARVAALIEKRIAAGELPGGLDLGRFLVEPPRDSAHGDLSTNAAMVYARESKAAGSSPRALAERLAADLDREPDVLKAEVAGPGFINIVLRPEVYERVMRGVLVEGSAFGAGARSSAGPVNVEYVSANPTGPMNVGHARGAVFGDALGEDIGSIPEGLYPGDYLKAVGEALASEFGAALRDKPEAEWLPVARKRATEAMMAVIRDDLATLNITHEVFASERELTGADGGPDRVQGAIDSLRAKGLIYEGRLPPPKGAPAEDW